VSFCVPLRNRVAVSRRPRDAVEKSSRWRRLAIAMVSWSPSHRPGISLPSRRHRFIVALPLRSQLVNVTVASASPFRRYSVAVCRVLAPPRHRIAVANVLRQHRCWRRISAVTSTSSLRRRLVPSRRPRFAPSRSHRLTIATPATTSYCRRFGFASQSCQRRHHVVVVSASPPRSSCVWVSVSVASA